MGTRQFAYNPGPTTISGVTNVGNLAIGASALNYGANPGGLTWWMGPEESNLYIVAKDVPTQDFPTPLGNVGGVQFWSCANNDSAFTNLVIGISGTAQASASAANTWLTTNGYWTNYAVSSFVTDNLFMKLDATNYVSGTWTDESGNSNDATINGATWLSTDGGIFDFDGSNDTISVNHVSGLSLSTSTSKTVQVWVKFDSLPALAGQQMPVFGKLSNSYAFDGYWAGLVNTNGEVRSVTNGTSQQRVLNTGNTVSIDTWYLYTFVSRISSTANSTKIYINTTQVGATTHGTDTYSESNPFYLGWIGSGVGSFYLNVKIGACYFYTKELTSQEVTDNYNATKSKYGL